MAFLGVRYSVSTTPIVLGSLVLYQVIARDWKAVFAWMGVYALLAAFMWFQWLRYEQSILDLSADELMRRWRPLLERVALLHGLALGLSVNMFQGSASYEFMLLFHVGLIGMTAASLAHQTPLVNVFLRFMLGTWLLVMWQIPESFPMTWPPLLTLAVLFVLGMYRHALVANRFMVDQVRLETHSQALAAQFKAASEATARALEEKNRFLATASHDLRQPVHAMGMLVAALEARSVDRRLVPLLDDLHTSMASLNLMFNSLLDLSRLEAGQVQVKPSAMDVERLVVSVAALYREQAHQQGLTLHTWTPAIRAPMWADPSLLRQALINLVHNALRYTPKGGVLVSARRRKADWLLEVWDTGVGVATHEQTHIFSPYYRSQDAWRLDNEGHGLGLAVVARTSQMQGIPYGMRSRLGRGSCFWMLVPALPSVLERLASASLPVAKELPELLSLRGCCLVVDDDPSVLSAWRKMLNGWGVQARTVGSGVAAQAAINAGFVPDAIFCDQRLRTGESGFAVLQALLACCPDARGAMVSGEFDSPVLDEAEAEGYLVLRKPVRPANLHALLAQWLPPSVPATATGIRAGKARHS